MSAAKKSENPEVQLIGLNNIQVDFAIQSRAAMHSNHQREFSEAILRGDVFPPIDVFWDGKLYWLADGFHRHGAHKKAGIENIRCLVHYGTRRDAIIFSAGANKKFSIPRSIDDKRKAAFMLFDDENWFNRSATELGRYVGIAYTAITRWRIDYCHEKGKDLPEEVILQSGSKRKTFNHQARSDKNKPPNVISTAEEIPRRSADMTAVNKILLADGIWYRSISAYSYGLGACTKFKGGVIISARFPDRDSLLLAICRVLLYRAKHSPAGRAVIVCHDSPQQWEAFDIAREHLGVEFMTPDELVERIKSEEAKPCESSTATTHS